MLDHGPAADHRSQAALAGRLHQLGIAHGDDLEQLHVGRQARRVHGQRIVRLQAERGRLDDDLVAGGIGGSGRGGAARERVPHLVCEARGLLGRAVGDRQPRRAGLCESKGYGPPGAARAEEQHRSALRLDAMGTAGRDQPQPVEHLADQPSLLFHPHRVDRTGAPAVRPEPVAEPRHRRLVRDGDDEPLEVPDAREPRHERFEILRQNVKGHEERVAPLALDQRIHELRRPDVSDRMREDRPEMALA